MPFTQCKRFAPYGPADTRSRLATGVLLLCLGEEMPRDGSGWAVMFWSVVYLLPQPVSCAALNETASLRPAP